MDIKGLIFDKDGTLVDFGVTFNGATKLVLDEICQGDKECIKIAAEAVGFDLETNKILPNSVIIAGTGLDIAEALARVLPVDDLMAFAAFIDKIFGEICLNTVEALPNVDKTLEQLHEQGYLLGMASNDAQENATEQLEELQLDHLFERILGSDSGFGGKPQSGMMDAFADGLGLQPHQVMVVGDSVHDLQAGTAAGMVTVGVTTGMATIEELEPYADFVLASVTELPQLLLEQKS